MATTDDTLRALLDGHLDRLRALFRATSYRWDVPLRRHRHERSEIRNAIHHVRALRKALGIRPHVTMTHAAGDLWLAEDGTRMRTIEVTPSAVTIESLSRSWTATYPPVKLSRAGWRRVNRDT